MKEIKIILNLKKIKKISEICLIVLLIFVWIFSGWPQIWQNPPIPPEIQKARAANTLIRQEINIINAIVTAAGDDSAIIQLDTTQYTGAAYYFETVAQVAGGTLTVALERAGTATQDATISVTATSFTRQRSAAFTPPAATQTQYNINLSGGTTPQVKAARIIILQDAATLSNTETQIEIGNNETAKNNTATAALSYPKYWYYDSTKWDASPTFYAEVTYRDYQVASSTTWSTAGTYTDGYVVSAGTSYATIEAWGGGGGGGAAATNGGGGGGGGAYARSTTTPAVGSLHTLVVADVGPSDSATQRNSTYDSTIVIAEGGFGTSGNAAGAGGNTTVSVGDVENAGGTGGVQNNADTGGGGGGAGGPDGAGAVGGAATASVGGGGGLANGNVGTQANGGNGSCPTGNGGVGTSAPTGGNGGGGSDTSCTGGGTGGAPGGGGGGIDTNTAGSNTGGAGQIKITETHGMVGIALEKDNGSFSGWTFVAQIVANGTATSSPARIRSAAFTPETGLNYRLVASTTATTASYDIYNAKIVIDQTSPTKLETQYLLANTLFSAGTALQDFDTGWDPAEWTTGNTYVYIHEADSVSGGTSDVKLQDKSGSPDVTNSTITDVIQREQSIGMTMPTGASDLDVIATTNSGNLYASRILVQVAPSSYLYFSITGNETFPSLTPGTLVATTTILTARTNNASGFNITVVRDDADTTLDLDTDAAINISDKTEWIAPTATTTAGNATASTTEPQTLQFRVRQSGTDTPNYASAWWGTDDTTANALFAGFASSTAPTANKRIIDRSTSATATTTAYALYNLDVPNTQKTGNYTGGLTYTVTANP